jgi:exosortase A
MNAPFVTAATSAQTPAPQAEWRRVAVPLGIGVLLLGAVFGTEVEAAVRTWNISTAYNHCFLIIPITLYLLWDRRDDLAGIPARAMPSVLLPGLLLAGVWLIAERLGIMEGRQLAAVSFAELLFLAVLGKRLWWAMAGPLLYLYFLVPFGEFLTPKLQDITTWFISHGLRILGIPAFIDGYVIEIPQGSFFVAEACAGLRFLIASIAFGFLYALMMYRSPLRRGLFISVSVVVPIIANGFRAIGIVYLGYLLGNAQAAAADHVIYGWLFFSAVILILTALGLPFRQDEISTRSASPPGATVASANTTLGMLAVVLAMVAVAAITPSISRALSLAAIAGVATPAVIDPGPGCVVRMAAPDSDASPHAYASPVRTQRVVCRDVAMDMAWQTFSPRITAAPLMAARRHLVSRAATEGLSESWLDSGGDTPGAWRIMHSNDTAFIIAVSIWVDGRPARPGLAMRMRMAMNSLFGSDYPPMVVTVTPAVDASALNGIERKIAEASLPAFLLSHPDLSKPLELCAQAYAASTSDDPFVGQAAKVCLGRSADARPTAK